MSAIRVPVLHCDGHTRTGPCDRHYAGLVAMTFTELRIAAEAAGWSAYGGGRRVDYCPAHRPVPVTAWSPSAGGPVTRLYGSKC